MNVKYSLAFIEQALIKAYNREGRSITSVADALGVLVSLFRRSDLLGLTGLLQVRLLAIISIDLPLALVLGQASQLDIPTTILQIQLV